MNPHSAQLKNQLRHELLSRHSLAVSDTWLQSFLGTIRHPPPPLPALTSTAHFRLLASDITQSLTHDGPESRTLPPGIGDVQIKSRILAANVPVQVLDIRDVGTSQWAQVEGIERVERGEEVRGREVIRSVPGLTDGDEAVQAEGGGNPSGTVKRSGGPHRLLLQDARGTEVYAFEMERLAKLYIVNTPPVGSVVGNDVGESFESVAVSMDQGLQIGCKILLKKGTLVRRGLVMLKADTTVVMGGKIDAWDREWRSGRKERLIAGARGEDQE